MHEVRCMLLVDDSELPRRDGRHRSGRFHASALQIRSNEPYATVAITLRCALLPSAGPDPLPRAWMEPI